MLEQIHNVLHAWFGERDTQLDSLIQRWLYPDKQFINHLREQFEKTLHLAQNQTLQFWLEHPTSCLAYIILCDQFPRLFYQGQPQALAYDPLALEAAKYAKHHELDKDLSWLEQSFLWRPWMHSESIEDQKMSVALYNKLLSQAEKEDDPALDWIQQCEKQAFNHYETILKFKRFPEYNALIRRESTQQELDYLQACQKESP